MRTVAFGDKARWGVAGVGAAVVTATLLLLFRLPPPTAPLPAPLQISPTKSVVQMARPGAADALLKEETEIRDLRPLFLPTEFNASLPAPRREPGRTFLDNETLKLAFAESELTIGRELPSVVSLNGKPADQAKPVDALMGEQSGAALVGFGRQDSSIQPLDIRGGFVEVVATSTGHRVFAEALPAGVRPPGEKAWEPIEFLAAVNAAGLATPLVVTRSSRVEEVDAHYRNFLARTYRIGDRLPPGFYRIVVGP